MGPGFCVLCTKDSESIAHFVSHEFTQCVWREVLTITNSTKRWFADHFENCFLSQISEDNQCTKLHAFISSATWKHMNDVSFKGMTKNYMKVSLVVVITYKEVKKMTLTLKRRNSKPLIFDVSMPINIFDGICYNGGTISRQELYLKCYCFIILAGGQDVVGVLKRGANYWIFMVSFISLDTKTFKA